MLHICATAIYMRRIYAHTCKQCHLVLKKCGINIPIKGNFYIVTFRHIGLFIIGGQFTSNGPNRDQGINRSVLNYTMQSYETGRTMSVVNNYVHTYIVL